MIINWYNIINKADFEATGLVSRTVTLFLAGEGEKDILVTKGNYISIMYDDVFLPVNLNDLNPFAFDSKLVYLDEDDEIWLGVLADEV